MTNINFLNTTHLCSDRLLATFRKGAGGWAIRRLSIRVRYSRGADFSGTCFYADRRIHINLGRHLVYPYALGTNLARAKVAGRKWYKPVYTMQMNDGEELAAFIFMHELYHLLVKKAKRNTRQKESMCDRFAARFLVDHYGSVVRDRCRAPIPREEWDWQNLEGFVAAARDRRAARLPLRATVRAGREAYGQLMLFS